MMAVNGCEITEEDVDREVQYHPAPSLEEARKDAAIALVVRELLLQEAARQGVTTAAHDSSKTEEEQLIGRLLEKEILIPEVDESAVRRYFDTHREKFRSPDIFEASHILFAAHPDDSETRKSARIAAEKTLEELQGGPTHFERLAQERSADTSTAEQGGHLGQIARGQTTPEFERCLRTLAPGQICRTPVATRYGYHIIRLDRMEQGRPMTFEMARSRIEEYLIASAWNQAVRGYIQILAGRAEIHGIQIESATTPLTQ